MGAAESSVALNFSEAWQLTLDATMLQCGKSLYRAVKLARCTACTCRLLQIRINVLIHLDELTHLTS